MELTPAQIQKIETNRKIALQRKTQELRDDVVAQNREKIHSNSDAGFGLKRHNTPPPLVSGRRSIVHELKEKYRNEGINLLLIQNVAPLSAALLARPKFKTSR